MLKLSFLISGGSPKSPIDKALSDSHVGAGYYISQSETSHVHFAKLQSHHQEMEGSFVKSCTTISQAVLLHSYAQSKRTISQHCGSQKQNFLQMRVYIELAFSDSIIVCIS